MTLQTFNLTGSALRGIVPPGVDPAFHQMMVASLPQQVKLGAILPPARPQALRLSAYIQAGYTLPQLPIDWASKAMAAINRMYHNDQYGCCVISDAYHRVGVWTANETGTAVQGTDQEVLDTYRIWNPGNQDNGCVITDVLDYCRDHGILVSGVRHKIDGYVAVDWTNWDEVQIALFLFGALPLGINLPEAWLNSAVWDATNSQIAGGHDVPAVVVPGPSGANVASWARIYEITKAGWMQPGRITECWAPLSPDWYANATQKAPNAIAVNDLRSDLAKLSRGIIPDIGPVTPPVPSVSNNRIHLSRAFSAGTFPFVIRGISAGTLNLTEPHSIGTYALGPKIAAEPLQGPLHGKLHDWVVWIVKQLEAHVTVDEIRTVIQLAPLPEWEKMILLTILAHYGTTP